VHLYRLPASRDADRERLSLRGMVLVGSTLACAAAWIAFIVWVLA
tara:strand:- start:4727 stop:4861 length:135 start_codon:yes stop_codon:yes gene_type:complete